jgi:hypothetical protein
MKKLLAFVALLLALASPSRAEEGFAAAAGTRAHYTVGIGMPLFDVVCTTVPRTCSTFVNASFSGTTTFSGTLRLADGTAAAPSLTFASDPTKGMFSQGVNSIGLSLVGGEAFRISTGGVFVLSDTVGLGFGASGDIRLIRGGANGALRIFTGTTPTGTGCGTGASYAGNNTNGSVTIGTTPGTCVITFNGTWTNAPNVYLNPTILTTGTTTCRATGITTTAFTITCTAALVATDKVSWLAIGP